MHQRCSREMQGEVNSLINPNSSSSPHHISLHHDLHIQTPHFNPSNSNSSTDDFLEQMLSALPSCSWSDLKSPWGQLPISNSDSKSVDLSDETPPPPLPDNVNVAGFHNFDESLILASKLRHHQIGGGGGPASPTATASAAANFLLQQQLMIAAARGGGLSQSDVVLDGSLFKSPVQGVNGPVYNGFGSGSMQPSQQSQQHFHSPQAHNLGNQAGVMNQQPQASGSNGGAPAQPRQRVRARRGQATDPHSIAERLRRERIAERMKALQELVPNANKTDKASMLDEIIDYVKFLQLQVKVLSMSRLGSATAVAPLVADISSEGGGDCINANNGGSLPRTSNGNQKSSTNDSLTVTEHQVAKLMEEDMGSAMQFLQGKGLCLMPISLATAISTATSHTRSIPVINSNATANHHNLHHNFLQANGVDGPSSPSMSVLTVQSATVGNGGADASGKDAASVSKP